MCRHFLLTNWHPSTLRRGSNTHRPRSQVPWTLEHEMPDRILLSTISSRLLLVHSRYNYQNMHSSEPTTTHLLLPRTPSSSFLLCWFHFCNKIKINLYLPEERKTTNCGFLYLSRAPRHQFRYFSSIQERGPPSLNLIFYLHLHLSTTPTASHLHRFFS